MPASLVLRANLLRVAALCLLAAGTFRCQAQHPACATDFPYYPETVMQAVRFPHNDLVLLSAHRGYWENVPENSWEAICEGGKRWEIVEADIKAAKDGPVVTHDFDIHRTTTGTGMVSHYTVAQFQALQLRNRTGDPIPLHPESARSMLVRYLTTRHETDKLHPGRGFVLALDIKDDHNEWQLIVDTYRILHRLSAQYHVSLGKDILFKVDAKTIPKDPNVIGRMIESHGREPFNIILVINPGKEAEADAAYSAYKDKNYLYALEINYPYEGASTKKYLDLPNKRGATGTFSTYYPAPEGYGGAMGECCRQLNTDTNAPKLDYRARWDMYLPTEGTHGPKPFYLFTTDRPDLLETTLKSRHLRNTFSIEQPPADRSAK